MRSTLIAALATGVLLAGCGATASTPTPVESATASGEVASKIASCKEGAPAELFKYGTDKHDGVVGTIYNQGTADLVVALANEWPGTPDDPKTPRCYLAAGKSVVFAGGNQGDTAGTAIRFVIYDRAWYDLPSDSPDKRRFSRNGTVVALTDPLIGFTAVRLGGFNVGGKEDFCPKDEWSTMMIELLTTLGDGWLKVVRELDNKAAAREWTGTDSWTVNDWARMDIYVTKGGACD
jgi:hypothetical protein